MKTLIVSSSLRPNSKSSILCKNVLEKLKAKGAQVEFVNARDMKLANVHRGSTADMDALAKKVAKADNYIFGMAVYCYSVNDSLKLLLDNCFSGAEGKFFGILCAAGGQRSYLSTMHLTQICMNEWRMMQLPRIVYVTDSDFSGDEISSKEVIDRMDKFVDEFFDIGNRLLS